MDQSMLVAQFVGITGADPAMASTLLETSDWQLESAVNLYFLSQGDGPMSAPPQAPVQQPPVQASLPVPPPAPTLTDAELAQQLAAGGDVPAPNQDGDAELAAAIAASMQQDVAPGGEEVRPAFATGHQDQMYERVATEKEQKKRRDAEMRKVQDAFGSEGVAAGVRSKGIETLFKRPAFALTGCLQDACAKGESQGRWVMANLIDGLDFQSQTMNRDLWNADEMSMLTEGYFLLWQCYRDQQDGKLFMERYGVYDTPHLCIIDPRTRHCRHVVQLSKWKNKQGEWNVDSACEALWAWAAEHEGEIAPGDTAMTDGPAGGEDPGSGMATDDAPQATSAPPAAVAQPTPPGPPDGGAEQPASPDIPDGEAAWKSKFDLDSLFGGGPEHTVRARLRFPDGALETIAIQPSACLASVYDFVRQKHEDTRSRDFDLVCGFPPRPLADSESADVQCLRNENVQFRWKN
eukprot:TRINITY_DN6289_c0_g1_i2.p1 TRINITY_DN6289_c0_g1~~TRINITY_DN6289_c0_g1_i2.p1  ORF type:complete len:463 (+),score=108.56 TRINITY_DN6289_c0_g1_i2:110-1498(+)